MSPGNIILHKLLEKCCCCNGACGTITDIFHICNFGFDLLGIFRSERKTPERFTASVTCSHDLFRQLVIIAQQAGSMMSKANNYCTGQRCQIYNCFGFVLLDAICQRICQDQTTFSICVYNLDCFAAINSDNITRL